MEELDANLFAAGFAQVLGRGVVTTAENPFGVLDAHLLDRVHQNWLGLGHGGFRRFVHAGFQLSDLVAHAELFHFAGDFAQFARQFDFHVWVVAEAAGSVLLRQVIERQRQRAGGDHQACEKAGEG